MFSYLVIAVIIILLISLFYWNVCSDTIRRKKYEKLLDDSAGIFDEKAQQALKELNNISNPRPDDLYTRGNIIRYNLLEGNIRGGRNETPRRRKERNEAVGNIMRDYTNALVGMRGRIHEIDGEVNTDFMLRDIQNFNAIVDDDDDPIMQQLLLGFGNAVTTHVPAVQKEIVQERVNNSVAVAANRADAIDRYFDSASKITNDRQNVHDSKVNSDLRETLRRLKKTAHSDPTISIEECRDYILNDFEDPMKRNDAINVLNKISEGGVISTFNDREDNIFAYTWDRCKHPANKENEKLMRDAVVTALADSVENGSQVCINGRCARVLNSLATLDYDTTVASGAMTYEAYKSQIFQETKSIINREIDRALTSDDSKLKSVGNAYIGEDASVDKNTEDKFKLDIKREIDINLEKYNDKLDENEINNLKQECYVYATI